MPKIARWAAAAAIAIVLAVAGTLAWQAWRESREVRRVPPAVPASVEQRSLQFTFSKVEGQQTVFTIHAAQATRFSHDKQSVLEDVDIVVYGEHGERHDEIHTRSCEYVSATGAIVCHGKVQLDLSSAPVPGRPAKAAGVIQVDARGVGFNRDTGEATSNAPVEFRFPEGHGRAVGIAYSSRNAALTLGRDVDLTLAPNRAGGLATHVTAKGGLRYDRNSGQLLLRGPVEIRKGGRTLETSSLTVTLGPQMRPHRAIAEGQATVHIAEGARSGQFQAGHIEIGFDSAGRAEAIEAGAGIVASQQTPAAMRLKARQLTAALDPLDGEPRTVEARGSVQLDAKSGDSTERLETAALHLTTAPAAHTAAKRPRVRLARATSPGPAKVVWQSGKESLRLDAKRLKADFDSRSQIRELHGSEGVRLERREAGQMPVTSEADALSAHFAAGEWTDAEESGHVRAEQGSRSASAERARWMRAENALELDGKARIGDPTGQTLARKIVWNQQSGELHASGHVRSTYFAKPGGETGVAPSSGPANVVADRLAANLSAGEATYSGGARLWQGDLAIQADRIELRRKSGELNAEGNLLAAFPQAPQELKVGGREKASTTKKPKGPVLWRVRANQLAYRSKGGGAATKGTAGKVVLTGKVEAWSSEGKISAKRAVLTLQKGNAGRAELAQAKASGGVKIRQGGRWGEAEKALYLVAPGKFVLTGGHPSLHDTSGNLVRGGQLTFYVADDTILVESSRGSRTLTRHPVPN